MPKNSQPDRLYARKAKTHSAKTILEENHKPSLRKLSVEPHPKGR